MAPELGDTSQTSRVPGTRPRPRGRAAAAAEEGQLPARRVPCGRSGSRSAHGARLDTREAPALPLALAGPGFGPEFRHNPPTCLPKQLPCVREVPGLAGNPSRCSSSGKSRNSPGNVILASGFPASPSESLPRDGNSKPALTLAPLCALGAKLTLQSAQSCPKLCQKWGVGPPCPVPYPDVLVGELLHLLLVQAGQEELVLQLLLLQGQQRRVLGLDHALPDPQVHGDGLGHPRGGARGHSSCGDTKGHGSVTGLARTARGRAWSLPPGGICHRTSSACRASPIGREKRFL